MAISPSPATSPSAGWVNRQEHNYSSRRAAFVDNALFIVSVVLFTMALLTAAFTMFALCFKRFCRRRPPLESRGSSVDLSGEKTDAESFPVFVYECKNDGDQGLECAVCLNEFEEEEKGRILPACNHSFHVDCIDKWLDSHSTCPVCRATARVDMTLPR